MGACEQHDRLERFMERQIELNEQHGASISSLTTWMKIGLPAQVLSSVAVVVAILYKG